MATNGKVQTNTTYESYFWVQWEQVGNQDVANNQTQIKWACGVSCGHSFYSNAIRMSSVYINGVLVYGGGTYSNFAKGVHTIASGTLPIQHNSDGTKSFEISAFTGWLYSNYNYSASKTSYSLGTIPRQATIISAPNFTDEQNPTINYSNPAGGAVTALDACISLTGAKDDIVYRAIPVGGTSYTFSLTEAERNVLRNATQTSNSRTVHFYVRTNINGTEYHSSMVKMLSIVNANPTYSNASVSYADTNTSVVGITGNNQHIVQNKSSLTVTLGGAAGKKGARITQYSVNVNGVTKTATASGSIAFGAVNTSQNTNISVVVTDSRGNKTTVSKQVTILPYSPPVVNATLARLNNYEDETYLTPSVAISSLNSKNTLSVSYKMKQVGGAYGSAVAITNNTQHVTSCDKDFAYIFAVTATDVFESVTREYGLDVGKFPLFIDTEKKAVGINAFPTSGQALNVAGGIGFFADGICSNGAYLKSIKVNNRNSFTIQTNLGSFVSGGNGRQSFFIFGCSNVTMVYGIIGVQANGTCWWSGVGGVTVAPTGSGGEVVATLPSTAWDEFVILSGEAFNVW